MNARMLFVALLLGAAATRNAAGGESSDIDIFARVAGTVERVHVKNGDRVKKGDLLFALDDRPSKAEVESARAQVEAKKAGLQLREASWNRAIKLLAANAISKAEFDTILEEKAKAQARLSDAVAELASASALLELTQVRAPVDGKVTLVTIDANKNVKPNQLVMRLAPAGPPPDSDKVKALLKERRDVLARAAKMQMDRIKQGTLALKEIFPIERALLEASLELAGTPKERVQLLRTHVQTYEQIVREAELRAQAGVIPETELLLAQAELLNVRIRLAREEAAKQK